MSLSQKEVEELLNSSLAEAEARARAQLASDPADFNALFLLGAALRRRKRFEEARQILELLPARQPQMAKTWFELGMALSGLGDREPAAAALIRAIDLDWFNEEAWYTLGDLLSFPPCKASSGAAADPRLGKAATALSEDRPEASKAILRGVLTACPDDVQALKLLADALIRTDTWPEAATVLERALEIAPGFAAARFRYIIVRCSQREFRGLALHVDELIRSDAQNLLYKALKALVLWWDHDAIAAVAEFRTFIDACTGMPGLWLQYARALRASRNKDAVAACLKALEILPSFVDAYVLLANLKSFHMDQSLIGQIRDQLGNPTFTAEGRARLHFVLGKAYEDLGDYAQSFDNYQECNNIFRASRPSGIANSDMYLRVAKTFFTRDFFRAREGFGHKEPGPIFIVGMPRAGSTLVEQILSAHTAVEALGELQDLAETGQRLAPDQPGPRSGYPYVLEKLDAGGTALIGQEYLKAARARQKIGKPFFTDKLPDNYNHIGLIQLALPNAKIIDMRRHPLDCCLSCFKHYFPGLKGMSLEDIGRAYANYVELMAHFDEVLPGRVHRVIYEDLVANPETEVRRLLDHVGLPFEERCLRFHENRSTILTLSADQVSVPLYASAIGYWRNYEQWLDPLKNGLGPVLAAYPAVPAFPRATTQTAFSVGSTQAGSVFLGLRRVSFGSASPSVVTNVDPGNPS